MPDLGLEATQQYWKEYDETIYQIIAFMESIEDFTHDGNPEVEASLAGLGKTLDHIGNIDLKEEEDFLTLVGHLKTGRGLRILMALENAFPGAAPNIIMHAEKTTQSDTDSAGIFLRRNIVFERLRLLNRVFSDQRAQLILNALEDKET